MKKISEYFYQCVVGIVGILGVIILAIILSNSVCDKPSSLNTGWFQFLVVIEAGLELYVVFHEYLTIHRANKAAQLLSELDSLTSRENSIGREVFKTTHDKYRMKPAPEREYIDLGLPSGTLWATENEQDLYDYDEANEKFNENMPSKEDFEELVRECYHKWDDIRKGIEFLSPYNGSTIFFPASGYRSCSNDSMYNVGSYGYYWSRSPSTANGYNLYFGSGYVNPSNTNARANGCPVRCVKHKD